MATLYLPVSRLTLRSNYRQSIDSDWFNATYQDMSLRGFRESEPIETYANGDGTYTVIDGNSRYAVAECLNRASFGEAFYVYITVDNTTPSDLEFIMRQLSANETRRDPDPISQAIGYAKALEAGSTPEQLATRTSHKTSYILARLTLLKLTPEAQHMVARHQLGIDYANELARLKTEYQSAALSAYARAQRHDFESFKELIDDLYTKQVQAETEQLPLFGGELVEYAQTVVEKIEADRPKTRQQLEAECEALRKQIAADREFARTQYWKLHAAYTALQSQIGA